jgi:hypothetical protein
MERSVVQRHLWSWFSSGAETAGPPVGLAFDGILQKMTWRMFEPDVPVKTIRSIC